MRLSTQSTLPWPATVDNSRRPTLSRSEGGGLPLPGQASSLGARPRPLSRRGAAGGGTGASLVRRDCGRRRGRAPSSRRRVGLEEKGGHALRQGNPLHLPLPRAPGNAGPRRRGVAMAMESAGVVPPRLPHGRASGDMGAPAGEGQGRASWRQAPPGMRRAGCRHRPGAFCTTTGRPLIAPSVPVSGLLPPAIPASRPPGWQQLKPPPPTTGRDGGVPGLALPGR